MDKKERFNEAYRYLIGKGYAHKQRDVSEKMRTTPPNLSRALKGMENVLTDNFLRRFNNAYNKIFNEEWLIFGEGEMLASLDEDKECSTPTADSQINMALVSVIQDQTRQIDRLIGLIENITAKTI